MFTVVRNFEYSKKLDSWSFDKLSDAKRKFREQLSDEGENLIVTLQKNGQNIALWEWDREDNRIIISGFEKFGISMPGWWDKKRSKYTLAVETEDD